MTSDARDFLLIDEMLTGEERMVRDTVRSFVDERVMPTIADDFEQAEAPLHLVQEMGEMGIIGATLPEEPRLFRFQLRGLRADPAGTRTGRQRHSKLQLGAELSGHVSDLRIRFRGAETALAPRAGQGRKDRMLRPYRGGPRIRPGRDGNPCGQGRGVLCPQRVKDVDHERKHCGRGRGLGQARR